jgi:heme exporter protein D
MSNAAEFFAMGGYGLYVWSSYGVAALVILGLILWSHWGLRSAEKREAQLGRRERRRPRREASS